MTNTTYQHVFAAVTRSWEPGWNTGAWIIAFAILTGGFAFYLFSVRIFASFGVDGGAPGILGTIVFFVFGLIAAFALFFMPVLMFRHVANLDQFWWALLAVLALAGFALWMQGWGQHRYRRWLYTFGTAALAAGTVWGIINDSIARFALTSIGAAVTVAVPTLAAAVSTARPN